MPTPVKKDRSQQPAGGPKSTGASHTESDFVPGAAAAGQGAGSGAPLSPEDHHRARMAEVKDMSLSQLSAAIKAAEKKTKPAHSSNRSSASWCARITSCCCAFFTSSSKPKPPKPGRKPLLPPRERSVQSTPTITGQAFDRTPSIRDLRRYQANERIAVRIDSRDAARKYFHLDIHINKEQLDQIKTAFQRPREEGIFGQRIARLTLANRTTVECFFTLTNASDSGVLAIYEIVAGEKGSRGIAFDNSYFEKLDKRTPNQAHSGAGAGAGITASTNAQTHSRANQVTAIEYLNSLDELVTPTAKFYAEPAARLSPISERSTSPGL